VRITAVVLSWNGREDTLTCLESLADVETVVVDNGSADGSPEAIEEHFPEVELIRAGVNLGFAAGCNVGIRRALDRGTDWVVLVAHGVREELGIPHTNQKTWPVLTAIGVGNAAPCQTTGVVCW